MPVDILIPVRDTYLLFRQLFESISLKIPNNNIGKVIVVDDHSSNKKLINYQNHLSKKGMIHLVRNGMPLPSFYSRIPFQFLKSKGHGVSLNIGLEYVTTEYALILDQDCIIMRGDLLKDSIPCFDLDPGIMSIGEVVGKVKGIKVIGPEEKKNPELNTKHIRKHPNHFGMTHACCMLVRMDGWNKHGLTKFWNGGWAHMRYVKSIFEKGYKTCNFNFFSEGYAIHLGRASVKNLTFKNMRLRSKKDTPPPYGMSFEKPVYADKQFGERYAGYLELKIPSMNYDEMLVQKYGNQPFDHMSDPVDPELFGPPLKNTNTKGET
jgi:hypothetical protein